MMGITQDLPVFDPMASGYDASFSSTVLGRLLRDAVHQELRGTFAAGDRVLDLGCGTGEDALRFARQGVSVYGVDASERMVDRARAKASGLGASFEAADLERDPLPKGPFDGAFSNFGVLNCIRDRRGFASRLADVLPPGAPAVFVVMGRFCPWEWIWYVARGRPRTAVRRLSGSAPFRGMEIHYATPASTSAEFSRSFRMRRAAGIGVLLPPSFAADFVERHPAVAGWVATLERRVRRRLAATILNDHFLIELKRI